MITAHLSSSNIYSSSNQAFSLFEKSNFGEKKSGKVLYSPVEALFLLEKKKLQVLQKDKPLSFQSILQKLKRSDKKLELKYAAYKDLRKKGYILKTALKFGADFRVYEPGKKPGKAHAPWLLYIIPESHKLSTTEFSAKARVAHSTKKKLLLAIIDSEQAITYYEISWKKP